MAELQNINSHMQGSLKGQQCRNVDLVLECILQASVYLQVICWTSRQ